MKKHFFISLFFSIFILSLNIISCSPVLITPSYVKAPDNAKVSELTFNSLKLTWDLYKEASGYMVYKSYDNKNFYFVRGTESVFFEDTSISPGHTYYYKVESAFYGSNYDMAEGKALYSHKAKTITVNVPFKDGYELISPLYLCTELTSDENNKPQVLLFWDRVSSASYYKLLRQAYGEEEASVIAAKIEGTDYTDSTVEYGNYYYYTIEAWDNSGKHSLGTLSSIRIILTSNTSFSNAFNLEYGKQITYERDDDKTPAYFSFIANAQGKAALYFSSYQDLEIQLYKDSDSTAPVHIKTETLIHQNRIDFTDLTASQKYYIRIFNLLKDDYSIDLTLQE